MADIKINLEAQQKQFVAAMAEATKNVNTLTAQLAQLSSAQSKHISVTQQQATAAKNAAQATNQLATAQGRQSSTLGSLSGSVGRAVIAYQLLYDAVKKTVDIVSTGFNAAIQNLDDFNKATIGTSAAITNIADMSKVAGKSYSDVFLDNLKATKQVFTELETLAARYFATSTDLQLAYNAFAQRGIVIRRSELEQLAQLTDMILLLTQGQQTSIQVQEEIRSLVNGTIRPTAQLAQLLKSYGKDVKQVAADIKATNSLQPLQDILKGAAAATNEIQKTFQATLNGLETTLRQIGRLGFDEAYAEIRATVERLTKFLQENKFGFIGLFGAAGNSVASILKDVESALERLLQLNKTGQASVQNYIILIASIEGAVRVMMRSIEVFVRLLSDIPSILKDVSDSIDIAFTPDGQVKNIKENLKNAIDGAKQAKAVLDEVAAHPNATQQDKDAAKNRLFLAAAQVSKFEKQLRATEAPFSTLLDSATEMLTGLPWSKGVTDFTDGLKKAGKTIKDDISPLFEPLNFDKRVKELQAAARKAESNAQAAAKAPLALQHDTRDPQIETPEEITRRTRAFNALLAARDRAARAERSGDITEIFSATSLKLAELRRVLALVQQGFIAVKDEVIALRSPINEITTFFVTRADAIAFGDMSLSVQGLTTNITELAKAVNKDIFANLDKQLAVVRSGLQEVKDAAAENAKKLIDTEVGPENDVAKKIREEATQSFKDRLAIADSLLKKAQDNLAVAKATGDQQKIGNAILLLHQEEGAHADALRVENQRLAKAGEEALTHELIAQENHKRIIAQMDQQIATQARRLGEEELRILQQKNVLVGQLLQQNTQLLNTTARRLVSEKAKAPRTDLQAAGEEINQTKIQFSAELGQAQGALDALRSRIETLGPAATQVDTALLASETSRIESLKQVQAATLEQMEVNRAFAVSWATIGNAVNSSLNTVLDSVLGAFEGKKTNFTQAFKGIADQMVKDSMKNVFQSITKSFQDGFQGLVKKIAPGMEETLGPAFMAGFGLIASFVLGQLMGDQGGSATASNPTVGIQSTEQVRGLIGGETQIPIGLVGESLQNALVPTNMWLARIAAGVERIGTVGGLNAGQIENIVEQSINNALQIQPA